MKNLRLLTPILMTIAVSILSYIVFEIRASKAYADHLMQQHDARPHLVTEERINCLVKEINELTIEVRLLRQSFDRFERKGG